MGNFWILTLTETCFIKMLKIIRNLESDLSCKSVIVQSSLLHRFFHPPSAHKWCFNTLFPDDNINTGYHGDSRASAGSASDSASARLSSSWWAVWDVKDVLRTIMNTWRCSKFMSDSLRNPLIPQHTHIHSHTPLLFWWRQCAQFMLPCHDHLNWWHIGWKRQQIS